MALRSTRSLNVAIIALAPSAASPSICRARRESAAIESLGPVGTDARLTRVIAPGGGAIIDPRNRWRLFRGRRVDEQHVGFLRQKILAGPLVTPAQHFPAALGSRLVAPVVLAIDDVRWVRCE